MFNNILSGNLVRNRNVRGRGYLFIFDAKCKIEKNEIVKFNYYIL